MRDSNNTNKDFDDSFKDHFGDFEVPKMRGKENQETEENDFDQLFQDQFNGFEQQPDEKIWKNVQKELPLHLIWKKKLNHLSRIAAVLLIGLFFTMLIAQKSDSIRDLVFKNNTPAVVPPVTPSIDHSDFVYDPTPQEGDIDLEEDSKTLFADETKSNNQEEVNDPKMNLDPLSPLPTKPIQELGLENNSLVQDTKSEEGSNVASQLGTPSNGEIDKYEADIMARNNMINPAQ